MGVLGSSLRLLLLQLDIDIVALRPGMMRRRTIPRDVLLHRLRCKVVCAQRESASPKCARRERGRTVQLVVDRANHLVRHALDDCKNRSSLRPQDRSAPLASDRSEKERTMLSCKTTYAAAAASSKNVK